MDRVDLLRRCLRGLHGQEVLVVHDGDRGISALLAELGVRGLQIAQRGVSAKRNAGWRAASTELVAFTDDDCEPAPGWLDALVADGSDFVAGPVQPHPEDRDVAGLWARVVTASEPGFYPGCNLLVRRSVLSQLNGFDELLHGGEDTDLAWRIRESGASYSWAEAALVWHAVRPVSFAAQLGSLPRWAGLPLVVGRHPELRALAYRRIFWKDSHPAAVVAMVSLCLGMADRRALVGVLPLLTRRVRQAGPWRGAQLAINDLVETAVLVKGSAQHRSLLL